MMISQSIVVRRSAFAGALLLISAAVPIAGSAGDTKFFRWEAAQEFEKGHIDGFAISEKGYVFPAPEVQDVTKLEAAFIWSWTKDPAGSFYFGTGSEGKVYRYDDGIPMDVFFDAEESQVYALAADRGNNVYVGTSPEGMVYRVRPDGKSSVYFNPEEKYIWDLAFDGEGNLFVATGEAGNIYRIPPRGEAKLFFHSDETHIRVLRLDDVGNVYAGSGSHGYLYKLSPNGEGFVLHDTGYEEVSAIELDRKGRVYFTGVRKAGMAPPLPPAAKPQPTGKPRGAAGETTLPPVAVKAPVPAAAPGRGASALFRMDFDGVTQEMWSTPSIILTMLLAEEHGLLIGTGNEGKLHSFSTTKKAALLGDLKEGHISALAPRGEGEFWLGTSNGARLYTVAPLRQNGARYESEARDAGGTATWGTLKWEGFKSESTGLKFFVRSGNTGKPNGTWSKWRQVKFGRGKGYIDCPRARFIQWAVELNDYGKKNNAVRSVAISYLTANLPPHINSVKISDPNKRYSKSPKTLPATGNQSGNRSENSGGRSNNHRSPGSLKDQRSARSLSWKAVDGNDDALFYRLYLREVSTHVWFPMADNLRDPWYTLDTTLLPDGRYVARIVASDSMSNSLGRARQAETTSDEFAIDNTAPVVKGLKFRWKKEVVELSFSVLDALSPLRQIAYSVDGSSWKTLLPEDGLVDSPSEKVRWKVRHLAPDVDHYVRVRVVDAFANVGYVSSVVEGD